MKKYLWLLGLLALIRADEAEVSVEDAEDEVIPREILDLPQFADPSSVLFFESFQGSSLTDLGWVLSTQEEYASQKPGIKDENMAYDNDKSLFLEKKHVRYGLSKKLNKPVDMKEDTIIVQFETRFQDKLTCSGAYLKFVSEEVNTAQPDFSEKTEYVLMFGPDKCGSSPKLHTIFRHQNPLSKEYEEKHMQGLSRVDTDKVTHLYTVVINTADSSVQVLADQSEKGVASATDEKGFKPSFVPPTEIDDPEDSKPEDWVDTKKIPDPEASKPDDWVDEEFIVDAESEKPEDWNDEEDGEWEPAQKSNPDYKGEWKAPMIDNPEYQGTWSPKKIPNPNYFEQKLPLKTLPAITHVFLEVLANDDLISFDNILITTNKKNADLLADHALAKQNLEKDINKKTSTKKEKEERDRKLNEEFGFVSVMEYISGEAKDLYKKYSLEVVGVSSVIFIIVCYFLVFRKGSPVEVSTGDDKKKDKEEEKKEGDSDSDEKEGEEPKADTIRRRKKE